MLSTRLPLLLLAVIGFVTGHRLSNPTKHYYRDSKLENSVQRLRMVTWNINDNSGMAKKIDDAAMNMLLFEKADFPRRSLLADIYAIGLQELCYKCDKKTLVEIPNEFLEQLHKKSKDYKVIGIKGTREVDDCIASYCKWGAAGKDSHGTTALIVLAKNGVVKSYEAFSFVDKCSHYPAGKENFEKGVAYMRLELTSGKSVCVATSHLDSEQPEKRRTCLKGFLADADTKAQWSSCDYKFISGDFNTRTASDKNTEKARKKALGVDSVSPALRTDLIALDELTGKNPYAGNMLQPHGNMLKYINAGQKTVYIETLIDFYPTYKIDNKNPAKPAKYGKDRPISWCDRVIHGSGDGKSIKYDSLDSMPAQKSDHFPVFEEFELL